MWSLLGSTALRGILGSLQVIGIVVIAASAQQWSQSFATLVPDATGSASPTSPRETQYLVENDPAMKQMIVKYCDESGERCGPRLRADNDSAP